MITSVFSKSKPINFVIAFFIVGIACSVSYFKNENNLLSVNNALYFIGLFILSYFSALLLNFISNKNSLTQINTFEVILYTLFTLFIPQTTSSYNLILANIFLLLSLRRIISLRTEINIKKKLFDASFWITIASLCYSWSVFFFLLIPLAIILYTENKLRHWLIPSTGVLSVLIITYSICFLFDFNFIDSISNGFQISLDYSSYNTVQFLVAFTVLLSFGVWASIFYIKNINQKKKAIRPALNIIIMVVVISSIISTIGPSKNGGEFLFMFAPLAIIVANYIEIIKEKWFKEVFLALLIIIPFALLLL